MKPVEHNVSPYLQQPLRSLEEVQQERARRQQAAEARTVARQETPAETRVAARAGTRI